MYEPKDNDVVLRKKTIPGIKCVDLIVKEDGGIYIAFEIPPDPGAGIMRQRLEKQQNVPVRGRASKKSSPH